MYDTVINWHEFNPKDRFTWPVATGKYLLTINDGSVVSGYWFIPSMREDWQKAKVVAFAGPINEYVPNAAPVDRIRVTSSVYQQDQEGKKKYLSRATFTYPQAYSYVLAEFLHHVHLNPEVPLTFDIAYYPEGQDANSDCV